MNQYQVLLKVSNSAHYVLLNWPLGNDLAAFKFDSSDNTVKINDGNWFKVGFDINFNVFADDLVKAINGHQTTILDFEKYRIGDNLNAGAESPLERPDSITNTNYKPFPNFSE